MKLYSKNTFYELYQGSMLDMLEEIPSNSVHAIITDPPYELNFMNKKWDNEGTSFKKETWEKCFEVLKPGGYLLAFGGSRTYHRITCAIEGAGFEIRDCIMWLYGSGFPKSMNIGLAIDKKNGVESKVENEWKGWGTCLKPAHEPIIVARKPFKGSLINNVLEYGVGGLNIDECRVGGVGGGEKPQYIPNSKNNVYNKNMGGGDYKNTNSRFPANIILDTEEGEKWRRYFYCVKASTKDRDEGLEGFDIVKINDGSIRQNQETGRMYGANHASKHNIHPTVKPTELMQYLVRLVTPKNGTILDPFMGSGSTGKAAMYENEEKNSNYHFIGIELKEEYLSIAKARIDYVCPQQDEWDDEL